jgi:hypothetical protein
MRQVRVVSLFNAFIVRPAPNPVPETALVKIHFAFFVLIVETLQSIARLDLSILPA